MSETCKECGCVCARCTTNEHRHSDVHLHAEIEHLRQSLMEKDSHIVKMETQFFNEADKFPNGELASMREELRTWEDKYSRLYEAHKRVQKVNQNLEDKLLRIVDKCETEKGAFTKDIATLSHRLADANYRIHRLSQDNAEYRNDVTLAIQLLQCKPSNFVGQKYDSLPTEVQAKVKTYIAQKRRSSDVSPPDVKSITVPISTFPPTAMVYNISKPSPIDKYSDDESDDGKPPVDIVSASIMAKVLEDREKERIFAKHCDTCVCHKTILMVDSECQTTLVFTEESYKKPSLNGYTSLRQVQPQKPSQLPQGSVQAKILLERSQKSITNKSKQPNKSKKLDLPEMKPQATSPMVTRRAENLDVTNANPIQTPVDIINDRIWKNTWSNKTKLSSNRSEDPSKSPRCNRPGEIDLDVINERIWKKNSPNNNQHQNVTLIEVTNAVNLNQTVSQSPGVAASPSFSSDSSAVMISSSEPSSSSSDLIQSKGDKRRIFNGNTTNNTARNCLMRVSQASKNILLDNARGNYQTVVYTSPESLSGSPNASNLSNTTALVHNNALKSRSLSTSSDEAFPILPNDSPTQLHSAQRVAEWVQSSVTSSQGKKGGEGVGNKGHTLINMPGFGDKFNGDDRKSSVGMVQGTNSLRSLSFNNSGTDRIDDQRIEIPEKLEDDSTQIKDLISFDSNNEEEGEEEIKADGDYQEIKITKEMEETYLKLAASLDPVSLSLSTCVNPDITIEKYRKDVKRLQPMKMIDKTGGA
ncbi:uncharacterized protein LOC135169471 [Diachasmimorpha longicaudata]|uniref:uncharacterized protein LOC135169471 n=1 Tax=Diachasmimorpha longicaudata TaxID=58733 RepID=UPI0030B895AA